MRILAVFICLCFSISLPIKAQGSERVTKFLISTYEEAVAVSGIANAKKVLKEYIKTKQFRTFANGAAMNKEWADMMYLVATKQKSKYTAHYNKKFDPGSFSVKFQKFYDVKAIDLVRVLTEKCLR